MPKINVLAKFWRPPGGKPTVGGKQDVDLDTLEKILEGGCPDTVRVLDVSDLTKKQQKKIKKLLDAGGAGTDG